MKTKRNYSLTAAKADREFTAPKLAYQPQQPKRYRPRIGLIGCGGISKAHLDAYRTAGWDVVALCDVHPELAEARRDEFYPEAEIHTDYQMLLKRADVDVVDLAVHPAPRVPVITAALNAGKHVLSQKPFVLDLDTGGRLVALAEKRKCKLAVNQNGRWSPYARYLSLAIGKGWIGEVQSVAIQLNWDHRWIAGTPFGQIHHVVLYDFAIHWFDLCALFFQGRKALSVFGGNAFAPGQTLQPPMLGFASIQFQNGMATLHFDAHSGFGAEESICITGTKGTLRARGGICAAHAVTLHTKRGIARPVLEGQWFNDGFRGAMGELLCAIEEKREPSNSARANLDSLALCFAAVASADTGLPQTPGQVRELGVAARPME